MGRASREKPARLAGKLRKIRETLGLSQEGMLIKLGYQGSTISRTSISGYELGVREPSLLTLYAYANLANVYMELLVDDNLALPEELPSEEKNSGKKFSSDFK